MLGPYLPPRRPLLHPTWFSGFGGGRDGSQTFLQPADPAFGCSARVRWMIGWMYNFYLHLD